MITYLKNGKGLIRTDQWKKNCWVNVENPTESEKQFIFDTYNIPLAFYNDIEDADERPRIEVEDGWIFILLRIPYKTNDKKLPYITVPLGLIFKDVIFVSICFYETEMISEFIEYSLKKDITKKSNLDLSLRLLLSSSVWYLKYLKQINVRIKVAESKLEKSIKNEDLQTLLQIEKCLVYFTTSLKGNDILSHRIKNLKEYKFNIDEELMEDVDIELRQALATTNIYSDILSGMMDAYASVISNNLNVIMKQLTSISIILMIPTLVASLYGMNVPNTFQDNPYGFWIIIAITFMLSFLGVMIFIKRKWF
jgi:magnesium transporter